MKRLLIITLALLVQMPAFSQDVTKETERKQQIEQEIDFIDGQLKTISSKQKASTHQLSLIQRKAAIRRSLIKTLDEKIANTDNQLVEKQDQITRLQNEIDTLEKYYRKLIYNTYKHRDNKVWFMYVLASENIGQGYRRMAYLKNFASTVNAQGLKIRSKQSKLEEERSALDKMKEESLATRKQREKEYKKLLSEEKSSKSTIKKLSKAEKQYRSELESKKKEVDKLNREIQRILSKAVSDQKKDNTKVDYELASRFELNKGMLPWPIKQGTIVERFGVHSHPVYKNLKLPENNGVTFSTTKNANVYCVFEGEVRQVVVMPGYNQCVLVQHGTYFTFYCKLQKVNVRSGQKVRRGDLLGTLDSDGNGSQLHFQIWDGTTKQDPEKWLSR